MSQLLCEQVVGRGLRRRTYELADNGLMTEEVSKVFGVPFQVIPFKATASGNPKPAQKRHHVHAVPARASWHHGQPHDYIPDFIIRLKTDPVINLILETKGFDDLAEVKSGAAQRWVAAVNADGQFGSWRFEMARAMPKVRTLLDEFL